MDALVVLLLYLNIIKPKYINKILISVFLLLFSIHAVAQFQLCYSGTTKELKDVFFINATVGIAVGDSGIIVRSTDGGLNWSTIMNVDSIVFRKVKFFDATNGIAVGSDIFISNDGGLTWTSKNIVDGYYDIAILNLNTAIVSSISGLLKTYDAGLTWDTLIASNTNNEFGLLSFIDESIGYTCTYGGIGQSIITSKTLDGGLNWTFIEDTSTGPIPVVMEAMSFVSEDIGFKGGWYNPHLQKTTNGANQWLHASFVDSMAYIAAYDFHIKSNMPDTYYACGWYGQIFKSLDEGDSWVELNSGVSNITSLFGIFFINDTIGWAVGRYGTILKTINGGGFSNVDELNNKLNIKVYPNPTDGVIYIENINELKIITMELLSMNGQILRAFERNETVTTDKLSNGFYYLRIITTDGIHIEKLIKE